MVIKMKILLLFSICIWTANGNLRITRSSDKTLENALYNAVTNENYQEAVNQAVYLVKQTKANIIQYAVTKLFNEGKTNVFDFAYKLWASNEGQEIVKNDFPFIFKTILSQNLVTITSIRDYASLKFGSDLHEQERVAYGDVGDGSSENVAWKFIPVWDDNKLYFKIFGINYRQYLNLGQRVNVDGDHDVYGDDHAETHRHEWYLKPVFHDDRFLFYIYNRQYNQALKLSREIDEDGDIRAYSHHEQVEGKPELFAWYIASFY